jgi:hypothetical protein
MTDDPIESASQNLQQLLTMAVRIVQQLAVVKQEVERRRLALVEQELGRPL